MTAPNDYTDIAIVRLVRLALRLGAGGEVTSAYIRETFGVSHATAKRDMTRLECLLPVTMETRPGRGRVPMKAIRLDPRHAGLMKLLRVTAA